MLGFIVEGHMEADIISNMCPTAQVRRLQINGCDFPITRICDRVIPQIKMLRRGKLKRIILIIDREQRKIESHKFEESIRHEILSRGISCDDLFITSPDRNFESWIVPFLDDDCAVTDKIHRNIEGENGKAAIRSHFRSIGKTYVETVDGVRLFKLINPKLLADFSDSFGRFSRTFSDECWWLKRQLRSTDA